MNKAFEKILERLEEKLKKSEERYHRYLDDSNLPCMFDKSDIEEKRVDTIKEMLEIVQEVSEEYNGGWIPCSEMLPDDFMSMAYLTTVKGHLYPEINYYCVANHKWFSSRKTTKEVDVIAWQPLPEPFKERD